MITFDDFLAVDMRIGRVLHAELNPRARKPAYILRLDFGELGERVSSAQLTGNYTPEELIGRHVVAVVNFPPKRIAGVKSEVLVLAAVCEGAGTVLLAPDTEVVPGTRVL